MRKVRFFRGGAETDSKFHVTVGHATTVATVSFFGAHELGTHTQRKAASLFCARARVSNNLTVYDKTREIQCT